MPDVVHILTVAGPAWLNANRELHWTIRRPIIRQWQNLTRLAARQAELPRFERKVHIDAVCLFPRADRRRDPANWAPTAKAVIDGLTDSTVKVGRQLVTVTGWLIDDDAAHLDGPDMRARVEPGIRQPTLELHITERGEATA